MRFFITNLLATALVVFAAGSASAIGLTLAGANGQLVGVGDSVTVTVTLDADVTGIVLISTGVLFDDTILSYNQGASSSPTYILYVNGKTPYMTPATNPPELRIGTTNQVNVDWTATSLTAGSGGTGVELLRRWYSTLSPWVMELPISVSRSPRPATSFSWRVGSTPRPR